MSDITRVSPMILPHEGTHAVAIVRVVAPWYIPNVIIKSKFRSAIGEYEKIPNLERKLYTLGANHHYGGIYLWSSKDAAKAFYSPKWAEAIRQRRGVEPDLRMWLAPYIIEGNASIEPKSLSNRSSVYPAKATLTLFMPPTKRTSDESLRLLAKHHGVPKGLIRSYLLVGEGEQFGVIDIWSSSQVANRFFNAEWKQSANSELGFMTQEIFDAPVMMNPIHE